MVQWLGLHATSSRGPGLIPGEGTKIPHATWYDQKKKFKLFLHLNPNQSPLCLRPSPPSIWPWAPKLHRASHAPCPVLTDSRSLSQHLILVPVYSHLASPFSGLCGFRGGEILWNKGSPEQVQASRSTLSMWGTREIYVKKTAENTPY